MIIDRYDLDKNILDEEILREIKLLARLMYDNEFDVLELKFSIKKIEND